MENGQMICDILLYIKDDFWEPLGYLAEGIGPALMMTGILAFVRWYLYGRTWKESLGTAFLCFLYGYVLVWQTLLSRAPGSRTGVDLKLWSTWGPSAESRAYVIENIALLFPLGVLLPFCWKRARRLCVCVWVGAGVSMGIELLQYVTKRGHYQTDDIVLNTAGTLAGWCVSAAYLYIRQKYFQKNRMFRARRNSSLKTKRRRRRGV